MTWTVGVIPRGGDGSIFEPFFEADGPLSIDDLTQLKFRLEEEGALTEDEAGHSSILAPGYTVAVRGSSLEVQCPDGTVVPVGTLGDDLKTVTGKIDLDFLRSDIELLCDDQ